MKLIKRIILLVVVIALCVMCYRHFKPQIAGFFTDRGISVPGLTDDTEVFPSSQTVTDEEGHVSVIVSVPPTYGDSITDEQLEQLVQNSEERLVAEKHEDGSVTLTIASEYRDELLSQMSSYYDDTVLNMLIEDKVISITHNADYSAFSVTCDSSMSESELLTLSGKLFAIGKFYGSFAGFENESIRVDIVNSQSGFITNSYVSDDMASGLASDARNWAVDTFDNIVNTVVDSMESAT